jgi:hypothetical protein
VPVKWLRMYWIDFQGSKPMKYPIDKGVPLPVTELQENLYQDFPLYQMEVGDSFLIPVRWWNKYDSKLTLTRRLKLHRIRRPKEEFLVKFVPGGIRCWRKK